MVKDLDFDFEFFVPGIPVPKGSAKGFYIKSIKRVVITQDNEKKQKPWASMIAVLTRKAGVKFIQDGPVIIDLVFYFPRPKGHFRTNGELKPGAPVYKTTRPDEDKLRRCVMDALTGIAYHDDSQVIGGSQFKYFCGKTIDSQPGCRVRISYPQVGAIAAMPVGEPYGTQGEVWNCMTGCTPVSEGCLRCYAYRKRVEYVR